MAFKDRFKNIAPAAVMVEENPQNHVEIEQPPKLSVTEEIKRTLAGKIALIPVWFEYSDEEKVSLVETFLETNYKDMDKTLSVEERNQFVNELLQSVYGFGELDIILADPKVSCVTIKEGGLSVFDLNNQQLACDIEIKNVSSLCEKLKALSGLDSGKTVLKFCFKNLVISLILPPVSEMFIHIKKLRKNSIDFTYLVQSGKIDEKILEFLLSLVKNKKSILISGLLDSGKTSYVEAFLGLLESYSLFHENGFLKSKGFLCSNLDSDEFENLLDAVKSEKTDYYIFDLNNGYSISDIAVISTIRADSAVHAVTRLAGIEASKQKITEKQSKADIASNFDYIIHLDKLYIASLLKLSLNKAGSLVMSEVLKHSDEGYNYNFEDK